MKSQLQTSAMREQQTETSYEKQLAYLNEQARCYEEKLQELEQEPARRAERRLKVAMLRQQAAPLGAFGDDCTFVSGQRRSTGNERVGDEASECVSGHGTASWQDKVG